VVGVMSRFWFCETLCFRDFVAMNVGYSVICVCLEDSKNSETDNSD
jgi:hypothetical protein